jgi:two-component sensor histidine kinase
MWAQALWGACFGGLQLAMRTLRACFGLKARGRPPASPSGIDVHDVVRGVVETLAPSPSRLLLAGPPLQLPPRVITFMALILHELATDAGVRGAWSNDVGVVTIGWALGGNDMLEISWQESGGPLTRPPAKPSFALTLIERGLNGASIDRQHPLGGLLYVITLRLAGWREP